MEQELLQWLTSDSSSILHAAVFISLVVGGFGAPIPEDIPLLAAGIAAAKNIVSLNSIFLTCYLGVLISDQAMFFIGYFFGNRILNASSRIPFLPSITPKRAHEVRTGLRKKQLLYIFIGRHLFPLRSATFLTAGALRIPFFEFLLSDALAALFSISLTLAIGFFLGAQLSMETLSHFIRQAHIYLAGIILVAACGYLLNRMLKRKASSAA